MRSENSVCYGCTRRTATCHATCKEHAAEAAQNEERLKRCRERTAGSYTVFDTRRVNRKIRELNIKGKTR